MPDSESALILAWQQGDEQATHTLFNLHYPRCVRLAVLSGLAFDDAQDCAQEAFLRAFEHRHQLRDPLAFPLWFQRIVTRHIVDALKVRQQKQHILLDQTDALREEWECSSDMQPEAVAISQERRTHLWRCVQMLPVKYRVPLILRYYGDYSFSEIAQLLEKREGTIRTTLHRALRKLRLSSTEASLQSQQRGTQSALAEVQAPQ
ncbi:RNA polymerase sigma factor [Ktedonobacter sp. SOSP1-85]|uniref:RNA polymerase sigma factor n=1 Tax=Ktedonobacter sp. SOSP1-85 TaxID=2778367 RepID=UPI001915DB9B|nr:RNA polymerase sigma factor [Ktedonobacter sp. SOSP1-85]GHO74004.1 RNA polymerase sigma factor [Ktedonobacter sp. SOSP1-85]